MAAHIGVIAEEQNDVDVLYEFTSKIIPENAFSFRRFIGHGCGKLRHKCNAWAQNLIRRGCSHLVVMHDLDVNDENTLRHQLEESIRGLAFTGSLVLIPVHEIEAWLLCDGAALRHVFSMKKQPKVPSNPEGIQSPKEHLRDLVWRTSRKHYVNTIHNRRIAASIPVASLRVCRSFDPYPRFLEEM